MRTMTDEMRQFTIIGLEASIARQQALLDELRGNGHRPRVSRVARAMERTWDARQNGNGNGSLRLLKGMTIRDAVLKIIEHEPTNKEGVVAVLKNQKVTKNLASMG